MLVYAISVIDPFIYNTIIQLETNMCSFLKKKTNLTESEHYSPKFCKTKDTLLFLE